MTAVEQYLITNSLPISATFYHPSEEAIAFQTKSKVGEKMVALFEECIEYRDKHYRPEENNRRMVSNGIEAIIRKKLGKIWLDELGLDIKEYHVNTFEPCGAIAIDYKMQDYEATITGDDIVSGRTTLEAYGLDRESQTHLERLKAVINNTLSFDKLKGKLEKFKWPIKLYIDIPMLFFGNLYVDKRALDTDTAKLSAREITAIYLHEAGHAMLFIERMSYSFAVQSFIDNNVNGFISKNKTPNGIKAFCVEFLGPLLKKARNNDAIPKEMKEKIEPTLSMINKVVSFCDILIAIKEGVSAKFTDGYTDEEVAKISTEDIETDENKGSIFIYIITIAAKIFNIAINAAWFLWNQYLFIFSIPLYAKYATLVTAWNLFMMSILAMNDLMAETDTDSSTRKLGDVKGARHNLYYIERLADEHAVRHGFGGDLATGLQKIIAILRYGNMNKYLRYSRLMRLLTNIEQWLIIHCQYGGHLISYEMDDMRMRRMCQDIIAFFKNPNVSGDVRDHYIAQMNQALSTMDKFGRKFYSYDANDGFFAALVELVQPANILRILTSGKLTKEYEAQLNKLENLSNNTMFFSAAQLKSLSDKIK